MKNHLELSGEESLFLTTPSGFPIRFYRRHIEPSSSASLHRHNEFEFVIVQSGALYLNFPDGIEELSVGQGALINSGVLHSFSAAGSCDCSCVLFSDEFIAPSGSDINVKYVQPFVGKASLAFVPFDGRFDWQRQVVQDIGQILALLERYKGDLMHIVPDFADSGVSESSCYELEVHALMCRIWAKIYSGIGSAIRSSVSGNEYVVRRRTQMMIEYIHDNFSKSISLNDIAASANISKSEAARCFQSSLHISPVAYLLRYRVEMAEQLLQNSGMTIEAIGYECGFSSASYFCKMFQRLTGTTPGNFRKNSKKIHSS